MDDVNLLSKSSLWVITYPVSVVSADFIFSITIISMKLHSCHGPPHVTWNTSICIFIDPGYFQDIVKPYL